MTKGGAGSVVLRCLEWAAVIVLGSLIGSAVAILLAPHASDQPALAALLRTVPVGLARPTTINLTVLTLTMGFTFRFGVLTVAGLAAAVALYLKFR